LIARALLADTPMNVLRPHCAVAVLLAGVAFLAPGCDPNPNGPKAPSAPASDSALEKAGKNQPPGKAPSVNPLKKVGEPIN
jgi:hypothetical protein